MSLTENLLYFWSAIAKSTENTVPLQKVQKIQYELTNSTLWFTWTDFNDSFSYELAFMSSVILCRFYVLLHGQ